MGFHSVAVGGACCTVACLEDENGDLQHADSQAPLVDPDGVPIRVECSAAEEAAGSCRALPVWIASLPGVLTLPPGCDEALAAAGITASENVPLDLADVCGSLDALWARRCSLPQWDQDFDGLGDACDLCPFAFDPDNLAYVDDEGMAWPDAGMFCHGSYHPDAICEAESD